MKKTLVVLAVVAFAAFASAADTAKHGCMMKQEGVESAAVNLDNGVKLTMTSTDTKLVASLQEHAATCVAGPGNCKECPFHAAGVSRSFEKIANGVVMTITATDPELVKKLQAHAAGTGCAHGDMKQAAGAKSCCAKGKAGAGPQGANCPHKQATTGSKS